MTLAQHLGTCRSCPARVIWCVTEKDKSMPVDPEPVPAGNLELVDRGEAAPRARVVTRRLDDPPRADLRTSHFATCPHAQGWRKKGRPS